MPKDSIRLTFRAILPTLGTSAAILPTLGTTPSSFRGQWLEETLYLTSKIPPDLAYTDTRIQHHHHHHHYLHHFWESGINSSSTLTPTTFSIRSEGSEPHEATLKHFCYFWLCCIFLAVHWLSLVAVGRGYSLAVMHRLLIAVASPAVEHGPSGSWASAVVAHRLSGPTAHGIFPDQGLNQYPLHCKADS